MKNLHWLPICKRVEHKVLPMVYKCTRGIAPNYLQELLNKHIPIRPGLHSGSSSTKLVVPRVTRQFLWQDHSVCVVQDYGTACQLTSLWHQLWTNSKQGLKHICLDRFMISNLNICSLTVIIIN